MPTNTNELLSEDILGKVAESQIVVPDLEKPAFSGAGVETIPIFHLSQYVFTQIKKFGGRFPQLPPDALHYLKQEEYFEDAPTEATTKASPWSTSDLGRRVAHGAVCTECNGTRYVPRPMLGGVTKIRVAGREPASSD